jgi:hypothetical protein
MLKLAKAVFSLAVVSRREEGNRVAKCGCLFVTFTASFSSSMFFPLGRNEYSHAQQHHDRGMQN